MAKTTIDGLRVREPSSNRRPTNVARGSAHTIDMMARSSSSLQRQSNRSVSRREMLDSIDSIRRKNAVESTRSQVRASRADATSSFLDPVETFDFGAESRTDFTEDSGADWSNLISDLEQLSQEEPGVDFGVPEAPVRPSLDGLSSRRRALPSGQPQMRQKNDFLESWGDDKDDFLAANASSEDDADEEFEEERHPKKQRRHKKRRIGKMVAVVVLCLLVIGGGILYKWGDELIARLTGGNSGLWDAIVSMVSDEIPFDTDMNGRTNVLIFGTEGYNMNGDTAFGAHDGAQLTDSIMVASFDQKTKDVALLSLPRDLRVPMACSAGKINEVFWCHNQDGLNEAAGAQALMDQVGDVLGIKFQYYAHINWASLIDIIDTIGGITVTLDENIADYSFTGAVAQAGVPMEVNGEQALGLARARHGTQGGDFTRGNTQQKIVEAIVNKLLQNGVGVSEALNLVGILGDNFRSNFSTDNIKAGVRLVAGFNIKNIRQVPLVDYDTNTFYMTTATINEVSYVVPSAGDKDYSEIREYVAEMFNSDPVAREHAKIAVYNASGQYGVAGAERDQLKAKGYKVVSIGDAELGSCAQKYCIYALNEDYPSTREALTERYGVVLGAESLPEGINAAGVDFVVILGFSSDAS